MLHVYAKAYDLAKKEQTIDMWSNMDKSQKPYAEWKKPDTKDITFTWNFLDRQTYRDRMRSVVAWS